MVCRYIFNFPIKFISYKEPSLLLEDMKNHLLFYFFRKKCTFILFYLYLCGEDYYILMIWNRK